MINKQSKFLNNLNEIQKLIQLKKFRRIISRPIKYGLAVGFREIIFPLTKKGIFVHAQTFFGRRMSLRLPGANDIYLFGAKTHDSEIRLAKFLLLHAGNFESFIDIGAHVGYFSLLTKAISEEAESETKIFSIEPSPRNFQLLKENTKSLKNIQTLNIAVSNVNEQVKYYQFSDLYSEYNTIVRAQFSDEEWFKKSGKEISVAEIEAHTLDSIVRQSGIVPSAIKIDVEGAEDKVIGGGRETLTKYSPIVIMEFLSHESRNLPHRIAHDLLLSFGYSSFSIQDDGSLRSCANVLEQLKEKNLDSDNMVYKK
ncbi:MAG: FkbM family methyltransferase [Chitinophagales bacterium]